MAEANAAGGMRGGIRPLMAGGLPMRPGPYDRGDRFGMGMGMMGMPFGRGRGRNLKGFYEDEYDDYGYDGGMGYGNRFGNRRGGLGLMRGGRGMGMMDRRAAQPGSCYVSRTGHSVHMRGLPFQAMEQDVFDFFSPIQPVRCEFEFGDNGRPTGEANVDFATHQEALEAMKKHKCNMQHRYIELFLNSEPNSRVSPGVGGGYGSGMGEDFGGMGGGGGVYDDDLGGPGYGQGGGGSGFGGGYGSRQSQGFGGSQGGYGQGGGFGNQGRGVHNYSMGGGYGDGMGSGGGMMGNNYTAF